MGDKVCSHCGSRDTVFVTTVEHKMRDFLVDEYKCLSCKRRFSGDERPRVEVFNPSFKKGGETTEELLSEFKKHESKDLGQTEGSKEPVVKIAKEVKDSGQEREGKGKGKSRSKSETEESEQDR